VVLLAIAAAAAPSLLAYNVSPSPTFVNQALALGLWAAFALICVTRPSGHSVGRAGRNGQLLPWALGLVALGVLWSWGPGALPASLALSALGMLFAAATCAAAGAVARPRDPDGSLFTAFATAWVIAGVLNTIVALIQVFAPGWADGNWIASSNLPGRAVGNLRQPNHLSSLLVWSLIAAIALVELGSLQRRVGAALAAIFVFGIVLTASRTGLLSVALLALWGLLDRRSSTWSRVLLGATPLMYAAAWFGMAQWAALAQSTFGGAERLAEVGDTSSRFSIWSNTLALLRDSPWTGVGFGEFNFAWTLTAFPGRSTAFFDHTHNLPLHLAVELGLPLAAAVMGLLLYALWRAARLAWSPPTQPAATAATNVTDAPDARNMAARAGVLMVLMIGVHSQLEYPLWYAYFLLPAAWVWGYALGTPATATSSTRARPATPAKRATAPWLAGAAALVVLGAVLSIVDYTRVTVIFAAGDDALPLERRIEAGRRSVLFSHHADYAAVTSGLPMRDAAASFASTTHYLLDGRLMVVWAEWLDAQGQTDLARHLAARLREFRSPDAGEFFAACPAGAAAPTAASAPFQCLPAQQAPHWRAYLAAPR
jgi:O-antigen ligase